MDSGLKYLVLDGVGVAPLADNCYYLGSDNLGFIGLKFPDLKLYQIDANTLSLENLAGGTYKSLVLGELASGPTNGNTLLLKANDTTFITLTTGVTDVCTLGVVTVGSGLIWSAAQNLNSQALTNVNIDSGTIDGATITAAALSGIFTAAAAVTLPAFTLGGTVTGGNQNINNLGHIGLANNASTATDVIYANQNMSGANPPSANNMTGIFLKTYLGGSGLNYNYTQGLFIVIALPVTGTTTSGIHVAVSGTSYWYGNAGTASAAPLGLVGVEGNAYVDSPSGTTTGAASFYAKKWGTVGSVVTNAYGMYIASPTRTAGTITNAYGIYIGNITGATTLNYAIYSLGGLNLFTGGIQGLMTPAVTAASQTINAAPTANALTAAGAKSFTGTAQHLVLPSITPAADGGGITLTGLNITQGVISNVADSEAITVKLIVIAGAAGAALVTGIYTFTGIDITTPAQAANGVANVGTAIKITGGALAGVGGYQHGIDITMAAATDYAIYSTVGAWYMSGALTVGSDVSWLPATDQQWSIGSDAKRLLLVRAVTITSGRHNFEDKFYMEEDAEFLRFHDYQTRTLLMKLDREGNLYIRGAVKEFN